MNFRKYIFPGRARSYLREAQILNNFVLNLYHGEELLERDAHRNLRNGLIEIMARNGNHSSNGLLISENGYFVTAKHCLSDGERNIRLSDGTIKELDRKVASTLNDDVVLAKLNLEGEAKPLTYKFYNSNGISSARYDNLLKYPIALISRWEGEIVSRGGFIREKSVNIRVKNGSSKENFNDHFTINLPSIPGDSGGVIVSIDGRLIGVASTGGSPDFLASGVKLNRILNLIDYYKRRLEKRWG